MGLRSLFGKKKKLPKTTLSKSSSSSSKSSLSMSLLSSPLPQPPSSLSLLQNHSRAPITVELEYVFRKFDANGDGRISSSELGSMMKCLGQHATEEEVFRMIQDVDCDGDGHINLQEFIELNTKGVDSDEVLENLKEAFSIFDIDGNGSITAEELHMVMASLGDECSIDECRRMIAGVDGDGNGMINFEEFKIMMTGNT
ncbi:probable calcium-binding protein CML25 [Vigna umbellata]|uniref:Calcium-binding protein n=3 Tax=Vigna TaxID=3913 RepID=A0A0L9UTE2_PHAAN|nr:probable calcium-binding protein CML25 [Vigna angularis]XP_047152607.1 probable calcium-binding protein CML25 [Vigna umbellata]KAG2377041.1 calcium-binding protein [Vigna angularis]KOM45976.1 hypothetical protein LR48_Vigan06g128200 [Vigna angularis]BAT99005.1 hypothetical protein VIGAN_10037700 [Vigna angularis var. angularis]